MLKVNMNVQTNVKCIKEKGKSIFKNIQKIYQTKRRKVRVGNIFTVNGCIEKKNQTKYKENGLSFINDFHGVISCQH